MVIVVDSPSVMLMYYDSSLICFFVSVADDVLSPFSGSKSAPDCGRF